MPHDNVSGEFPHVAFGRLEQGSFLTDSEQLSNVGVLEPSPAVWPVIRLPVNTCVNGARAGCP